MRRGDNRFLDSIRETAFNERITYQLGNRWQEDIKTILKEECWYRVELTQFSGGIIDNLEDNIFSNRHKGIGSRRCQVRCVIERARSRECIPDFAYLLGENRRKCPQGFYLSCEQAKQFRRCRAIPSVMTAISSWGHNCL